MTELVFVYNANAGLVAGMMDSVHKLVSPATYSCDLCAITYGLTSMDKTWRIWLRALTLPTRFYHRPDFKADWPEVTAPLPAIFVHRGNTLDTLVSASEFKAVESVNALIALLEQKMKDNGL
jgi:hypothetical protein